MIMIASFYSVQYIVRFLPIPFFHQAHRGTYSHSQSTNTAYLHITCTYDKIHTNKNDARRGTPRETSIF